jgi:hypothetical protein
VSEPLEADLLDEADVDDVRFSEDEEVALLVALLRWRV